MRRKPMRRESPLVSAAVGASLLAIPATAAALDPSPSPAGSGNSLQARAKRGKVAYEQPVVVDGHAPSSDAGQTATLQFQPSGGGWRQVASTRIASDGSFRLTAALRRSGLIKATTTASNDSTTVPLGASAASTSSSSPERVAVTAALRLHRRAINDMGTKAVTVRGRLLPGLSGRRVLLQARHSRHWATLASGRTRGGGSFALRYRPTGLGQQRLRVRFAGDTSNAAVWRPAGTLTVYRHSTASWYDDGGSTACGFHAYYGVANLSLPCGTGVDFSYHGRTVHAVVDDRGPYVSGRTWDLNQNIARALGFGGVDTVWSSR